MQNLNNEFSKALQDTQREIQKEAAETNAVNAAFKAKELEIAETKKQIEEFKSKIRQLEALERKDDRDLPMLRNDLVKHQNRLRELHEELIEGQHKATHAIEQAGVKGLRQR